MTASDSLGSLRVRRLGAGKDGLVIVLCHGFGAPGDDLVPIGRSLAAPPGTSFVFPAALHSLSDFVRMPVGDARAWWPIDLERIERAMQRGEVRDLTRDIPEGLAAARAALISLLDALHAEGVAHERVVLGGFSQGAMLATDVVLRTDRPFAGLIAWSGTMLCEDEWVPKMAARKGLPTYVSHGKDDPLLPFSIAERLRDAFIGAGLDVTFRAFPGGHTIPPPVTSDVEKFLAKISKPSS
jgi:phospholipase/carboxylesterase